MRTVTTAGWKRALQEVSGGPGGPSLPDAITTDEEGNGHEVFDFDRAETGGDRFDAEFGLLELSAAGDP